MRRALACLLLAGASATLQAHPKHTAKPEGPKSKATAAPIGAKAEALGVVTRFHAALAAGRRDEALALMDDNVVVLESGGSERSKAEYAAAHLDADMEYSAATQSTLLHRASVTDKGLVVIASESHVTGDFRGRQINSMSAETMVLKRFEQGWRIVHIHWSSGKAN